MTRMKSSRCTYLDFADLALDCVLEVVPVAMLLVIADVSVDRYTGRARAVDDLVPS